MTAAAQPMIALAAMPTILVDVREQRRLRFSAEAITEDCTLPTGDYSLLGATARVAIERKSLSDLVACCGSERARFLDCCARLQADELRAVVVEASIEEVFAHRSRLLPQCVIGTVVALHVDYAVPTIWAGDARNAAQIVERLLTRVWKKMNEQTETSSA